MRLLWAWITRYGIPQAVYCDRKNAFVLEREPTIEEQLRGVAPRSPFETACEKLGIEVIVARSPQAMGQVDRKFAKPPIDAEDAHVPLLRDQSLESIFCFEEQRVVSEDCVLQFERRLFQFQREKRRRLPTPGTPVTVQRWLDGSLHFLHNNKELLVEEIPRRRKKQEERALSA